MMPANEVRTEWVSKSKFAAPVRWVVAAREAPCTSSPFEIDDEELECGLAELPEVLPLSPDEMAALEQAQVPSLWLL